MAFRQLGPHSLAKKKDNNNGEEDTEMALRKQFAAPGSGRTLMIPHVLISTIPGPDALAPSTATISPFSGTSNSVLREEFYKGYAIAL